MPDTITTPYRRFVAAAGLTNLADGIALVAWTWLATLLTRDPLIVSAVPIALRLPWFLFAIPAGLTADRVDRRQLIIAMDVVRALAFAVAGLAVFAALPLPPAATHGVSDPALFAAIAVAALAVGCAEVFRDNAAQTMMPRIVHHDDLERANARMAAVERGANELIGPVLGAALLGLFLPAPFLLNAAAFGLAVLAMVSVGGSFRPMERAKARWREELREAWRFLVTQPLLRTFAWTTGFWNLTHQMTLVALVFHAQVNLGLGASGYALLLAGGAAGSIAGGMVADRIVRHFGPARVATSALFVSAAGFLCLAVTSPVIVAAVLFCEAFAGMCWDTVSVSNRQRLIPDTMMGRVNSLYRLLAWGMMPVGIALGGLAIRAGDQFTSHGNAITWPFIGAGIGCGILAFAMRKPIVAGLATVARPVTR